MDAELKARIDAQDQQLEAVYQSVEKTRKYLLIALWITIIAVALPLVGLIFAIPAFLNTYMSVSSLGGL